MKKTKMDTGVFCGTLLLYAAPFVLFAAAGARAGEREQLGMEIQGMVSDLSCDGNAQCKSVGFGSRPCGGYAGYLVYSTKGVDEKSLVEKAARYYELDKAYNAAMSFASICSLEEPEEVACMNGRCVGTGSRAAFENPPISPPAPAETLQDFGIDFSAGSADIGEEYLAQIDALAAWMLENATARVEVRAHASDAEGQPDTARSISLARVLAIRARLIDHNVNALRIDVRALGDTVPDAPAEHADIVILK